MQSVKDWREAATRESLCLVGCHSGAGLMASEYSKLGRSGSFSWLEWYLRDCAQLHSTLHMYTDSFGLEDKEQRLRETAKTLYRATVHLSGHVTLRSFLSCTY